MVELRGFAHCIRVLCLCDIITVACVECDLCYEYLFSPQQLGKLDHPNLGYGLYLA